jgi:predicted phage terminase large subunit-like protein
MWARNGADFYLLDQVHGRFDFPATIQQVRQLNDRTKHRVNAVLIEDKANGSAVVAVLKQEISGVLAVQPEGGKESRAAAVAPLIEAGNVRLPMAEEQPWIEETLLEFVSFPSAKHDDRVDAASQAILWLQQKRKDLDGAFIRSTMASNEDLWRPSPWRI